MNAQHLSIDELADAAEGLLDPERAAFAEAHIAGCPDCQSRSDALRNISATLRAEPATPMPEAVAHRLQQVVAAESAAREAHSWRPRPTLGTFGADLKQPSKSRWLLPAFAAARAAVVVGFGAYLISAAAGLNEPPVVAAVNSSDLGVEARALEQAASGLSPHRFSQAWDCARKVTEGRITGLAASAVDGDASAACVHQVRRLDSGHCGDGLWCGHAIGWSISSFAVMRLSRQQALRGSYEE